MVFAIAVDVAIEHQVHRLRGEDFFEFCRIPQRFSSLRDAGKGRMMNQQALELLRIRAGFQTNTFEHV